MIHAQNTVSRRNQSNELTEALDNIRVLESEFVRKIKELDELRNKLLRADNKNRKDLEISLAASGSPDNFTSSPPSPEIMVTDTGSM